MKKIFCEKCNEMREFNVKENLIHVYKGSEVNVIENIAVCNFCGEELFNEEFERDNLKRLYDKYAEMNHLISAKDIIEFRNKYGISQRELTSILDLGKMTINRYENGSLPTKSNSEFLKMFISNEDALMEKVENAYESGRISLKTYQKVKESLETNALSGMLVKYVNVILTHEPSEFNGFKKFDLEKTESLIAYLAEQVDLTITSVNKYLWYIDFAYFKKNMTSITGLTYVKEKFGPVVINKGYEELLKVNPLVITHEEENGEYRKKCILKVKEPNMSLFSEREKKIIDEVINEFKHLNVTQISDESHKEKGWTDTEEHEKISYSYALELINF
jgi:putative zinc finger/helix-turn-helix YgiT family protein